MLSDRIGRAAQTAAIACSFVFIVAIVAFADDRRQNAPGEFDFYALALSWSPSFCESAKERAVNGWPDPQCSGRPFAFVVHGLWPQYEQGFPSYCRVPAERLDRAIVGSALDLMPSPRLWTATAPARGSRRTLISRRCARRARW
jgi:ribonuclease T2